MSRAARESRLPGARTAPARVRSPPGEPRPTRTGRRDERARAAGHAWAAPAQDHRRSSAGWASSQAPPTPPDEIRGFWGQRTNVSPGHTRPATSHLGEVLKERADFIPSG